MTCATEISKVEEKRLKTIESIKNICVEKFADDSIKNLFAPESFSTKKEEIAAVRKMIVNTLKKSLHETLHAFSERKCCRIDT